MASGQNPEKRPRSQRTTGNVSHDAQQRVDIRVKEVMACRNAAEALEPPKKPSPARRPRRAAIRGVDVGRC